MPKVRCPNCATVVTHAEGYQPICPTCGFGKEAAQQAPAATPSYGFSAPPPEALGPQAPQNGLAIGALVCGIAGFLIAFTAPVAVILGIVALNQRVDSAGRAMAIVGLVLGALVTVGIILVLVFLGAILGSF